MRPINDPVTVEELRKYKEEVRDAIKFLTKAMILLAEKVEYLESITGADR
jgi:hypothetical protein